MPKLTSSGIAGYLASNGETLSPETLVYLIREFSILGNSALFRRCGELLVGISSGNGLIEGGHCEGIIQSLARSYGYRDPDLLKEYRAACYERLWRDIAADRAKCHFIEERFGKAFKDRAIDVARSMHRQRTREHLPLDDEVGGEDLTDDSEIDSLVIAKINMDLLIREIRRLPPQQQRSAQLVWLEGWQIDSNDPDALTAASFMGISGRMVRKHLKRAREKLLGEPSLRRILEDDGRI